MPDQTVQTQLIYAERGIWSDSTLFITHPTVLDTLTGNKMNIFQSLVHVCKELWCQKCIMKTYLYNFDPLIPHFYIVKLGFTGVCINFLISAQNIDCGYSLEPPRRGGSNEYPQSMF